jgi:hypothetical protein
MYMSEDCSECSCVVTFIRLSRIGQVELDLAVVGRRHVGVSWTLERTSTIVSVEEGRGNILQIRRAIFCEDAIHSCCGNHHYDHIGSLEHLFWRRHETSILQLPPTGVPCSTMLICFNPNPIEFNRYSLLTDRRERKHTI